MIRTQKNKRNCRKKFRLRTSYVFLTYPKCGMDLETILDQHRRAFDKMDTSPEIKNYIVAHELHKDGTDHRHCWYELTRDPDYFFQNLLDLTAFGETYSGNYQDQKFYSKCAKYVTKGEDYITSYSKDELELLILKDAKPVKLDWNVVSRELMAGRAVKDLLLIYPSLFMKLDQIEKNLFLYKKMTSVVNHIDTLENVWYWGETGAGKSRFVHDKHPDGFKKEKSEFWDGYAYEEYVYLEDVDDSWTCLESLKNWADHWKFKARIKHMGGIDIRPKVIIVTSNYTIEELYLKYFARHGLNKDYSLINAIERRFRQENILKPQNPDPLSVYPPGYFCSPSKSDLKDIDFDEIDRMLNIDSQKHIHDDNFFI